METTGAVQIADSGHKLSFTLVNPFAKQKAKNRFALTRLHRVAPAREAPGNLIAFLVLNDNDRFR